MNKPITITMMELRSRPGLYIFWECGHVGKSIILTHAGRPIAKIVPYTEPTKKENKK